MRHQQRPDGIISHDKPPLLVVWNEYENRVRIGKRDNKGELVLNYSQAEALYQVLQYLFGPPENRL